MNPHQTHNGPQTNCTTNAMAATLCYANSIIYALTSAAMIWQQQLYYDSSYAML